MIEIMGMINQDLSIFCTSEGGGVASAFYGQNLINKSTVQSTWSEMRAHIVVVLIVRFICTSIYTYKQPTVEKCAWIRKVNIKMLNHLQL